jgi:hypothetical protein
MVFREATDSGCAVFQLPEEIGPPFTEYEFTEFQIMPISYRAANLSPEIFSYIAGRPALKPRVLRKKNGLVVEYALSDCEGALLEKTISFRRSSEVEIRPKITNNTGAVLRTKIAFRTCLSAKSDPIIRAPIYRNSVPAEASLSDRPYYIGELILDGKKLEDTWTAFEFPESDKSVGLAWQGNPEYDFFPLWFNKMPWLMYDVNLKNGEEIDLPPLVIAFKNGSWKAIREIWNKNSLMETNDTIEREVDNHIMSHSCDSSRLADSWYSCSQFPKRRIYGKANNDTA